MRVLSATEAVAPAIQRTKEFIFQNFHWKRSWKLAAVGLLSCFGTMYVPNLPINRPMALPPGAPASAHAFLVTMIVFGALMSVVMSVVTFGLFYVGARMEFVLFEAIVTQQTIITPLWRKYRSRTWRWIAIKIIPSVILLVPFVLMMLHFTRTMAVQTKQMQQTQPGHPPSLHFFMQFFAFFAAIFALSVAAGLASALLNDFALPAIALEDASIGLAWKRFFEVFQNDPPGTLIYVLMKLVLYITASIASGIALVVAILVPGLVLALGGMLLHLVLHHAGIAGSIVIFLATALAILAMLVYAVYVHVFLAGTVFTLFQAYAIYFLGGRYKPLGDVLEPALPEPAA